MTGGAEAGGGGLRALALALLTVAYATVSMDALVLVDWLTVSDMVLGLAMILAAICARGRRGRLRLRGWGVPIGVLVAGALVGSAVGPEPGVGLESALRLAWAAVGVVGCTWLVGPNEAERRRLVAAFVVGTASSVVYGVVALRGPRSRALGLSTHSTLFAVTCALAIALALVFAFGWRVQDRRRASWTAVGGAALLTYGLTISGARGGLVAVAAVLALVLLAWGRPHRGFAAGAIGVLVLSAGVGVSLRPLNAVDRLATPGSFTESDAVRWRLIEEHVGRVVEAPITGQGLRPSGRPHNIYLEVWSSAGVLGLAGLVRVLWLALMPAVASLRRRSAAVACVGVAASLAVVAYGVAGMFENLIWHRYGWACIALVAASRRSLTPSG